MVERIRHGLNAQNLFFLVLVFYFVLASLLYKDLKQLFFALVFWGLYILFKEKARPALADPVKTLLLLFLIVFITMTASILFQGDVEQLFRFEYENFRDLVFLYFITVLVIFYRFDAQTIFKLISLVSIYALIYVALVLIEEPVRGHGLLETPIARGNMGMLVGVMALVAFFGLKEVEWKVIALLGFINGVLLSFLSGSRGGWLTIVLVIFTLWIVFFRFDRRLFWLATAVFLSAGVLMTFFWSSLPLQPRIDAAINDIVLYFDGNPRTSIGYRFEMWKAAWLGFLERPLSGWGFGSFDSVYTYYSEQGVVASGVLFGHPHNDYMLFLVEKGVIGFVVVLLVFLYPFFKLLSVLKEALKARSHDRVFLSLLGIALIEAIMEFSLSDKTISMQYQFHFYMVFMLIIFVSLFQTNEKEEPK